MTNPRQVSLQQHPLSAAYPAMTDVDFHALVADIKKHGQRDPGYLLDGLVLDGWHRYAACQKIGIDFWSEDFTGEDPDAFVESKNDHRRHMNASQRVESKLRRLEWRKRGESKSAPGADLPPTTQEIAKAADASTRTVEHAKAAHRAGLGDEVLAGTISAKAAAEVAKLPPKKRAKAIKAIKDGEKPPAPKKPKAVIASREVEKLYEGAKAELLEVQGKYADLAEKNAELADTARELSDKLTAFETTDPDEQQKEIQRLQKRIVRLEAEVQRLTIARNECQNKNNQLIRQVKILQKGKGG